MLVVLVLNELLVNGVSLDTLSAKSLNGVSNEEAVGKKEAE